MQSGIMLLLLSLAALAADNLPPVLHNLKIGVAIGQQMPRCVLRSTSGYSEVAGKHNDLCYYDGAENPV